MRRILLLLSLTALTGTIAATRAANPEKLPFYVYAPDPKLNHWVASGYMGDPLVLDEKNATKPHVGNTCIKVTTNNVTKWGGVFWQDPANDWAGEKPGGFNLTGAKKLTFWARGDAGGEKINVGIGGDEDKTKAKFPNSTKLDANFDLTADWKQYSLDLTGQNLSLLKNGLFLVVKSNGKPITFYLSEIRYE